MYFSVVGVNRDFEKQVGGECYKQRVLKYWALPKRMQADSITITQEPTTNKPDGSGMTTSAVERNMVIKHTILMTTLVIRFVSCGVRSMYGGLILKSKIRKALSKLSSDHPVPTEGSINSRVVSGKDPSEQFWTLRKRNILCRDNLRLFSADNSTERRLTHSEVHQHLKDGWR